MAHPGIPDSPPDLETVFRRIAELGHSGSINIVPTRLQTGAIGWQVSCQRQKSVAYSVSVGSDLVTVLLDAIGPAAFQSWKDWLKLEDALPDDVSDLI